MRNKMRPNRLPMITASEVAEFVYCAKAWHLKRAGEISKSEHLTPGREFHAGHSAQVSFAGRLSRAGFACAIAAVLLLIVAALVRLLL